MCGKGQLPKDFKNIEDFSIIAPQKSIFAIIEGLVSEDVADAIISTQAKKNDGDTWRQHGAKLLRACCTLLEASCAANNGENKNISWTIANIERAINDFDYIYIHFDF